MNRKFEKVTGFLHFFGRDVRGFQNILIQWFKNEGKSYPWRETRDPYAILVSELMLQQTRIQTVLDRRYFESWMEKFPDPETLAGAEEEDLLKAWEGLGYYNRARNLQKAARKIVTEYDGRFPERLEEILELPGVGRYTAGAVFSFAFGKRAPIVDGNVVRVLSRLFSFSEPVDKPAGLRQLWEWAEEMTPEKSAREYNSAIMELGQSLCTRSNPKCEECPVEEWCRSRKEETQELFPVKAGKTQITRKREEVVLLLDGSKVFLAQETGSRRNGLWKLPECLNSDDLALPVVTETVYSITRYRVELVVHQGDEEALRRILSDKARGGQWFECGASGKDLPPMGSPYRKVLDETIEKRKNYKRE